MVSVFYRKMSAVRSGCFAALWVLALATLESTIPVAVQADPKMLVTSCSFSSIQRNLVDLHIPLVQVKVNGQDANFIIDTGTSAAAISDAFAQKLSLTPEPAFREGKPFLMYGKQASVVTAAQLQLAGITFTNQILVVYNQKQLSDVFGIQVDGIIGINVLSQFAMFMDSHNHSITFLAPGKLSADLVQEAGFTEAMAVPLVEADEHNVYSVDAKLFNNHLPDTVNLFLDTGSSSTIVPKSSVEKFHLETQKQTLDIFLGKSSITNISQVQSLSLADVTQENCTVQFYENEDATSPHMLGMDFLSHYLVLMDFPAKKMYLKPDVAATPPVSITVAPSPQTPDKDSTSQRK